MSKYLTKMLEFLFSFFSFCGSRAVGVTCHFSCVSLPSPTIVGSIPEAVSHCNRQCRYLDKFIYLWKKAIIISKRKLSKLLRFLPLLFRVIFGIASFKHRFSALYYKVNI